jgi:predicted 3-demethylubiquinone-9 3-methyltransferase (glyoxalase superfamily)
MLIERKKVVPDITPFLWFGGQAEEAVTYYTSVFENSRITSVTRYGEGGPGPAGEVMTIEFELDGKPLMAINDPRPESQQTDRDFTQGKIALFVSCETQAIVDDLWSKLAIDGKEMPCGWVQDRYGFAWNIVPQGLGDVLAGPDPDRSKRALQAMLQMEKLDIDELRRVYSA